MEIRNENLYQIARKRAAFKTSIISYCIVNGMLWVIWFFTKNENIEGNIPWPLWPMFGWGIGLIFQYFKAYSKPFNNMVDDEYKKLLNENK